MNSTLRSSLLLSLCTLVAVFLSACAPPTARIKVSRNEIKTGDPVTVSWETKNARTIELNGEKVEKIGARTVSPKDTTSFEIAAKSGKKEARDKATVRVDSTKAVAPAVTLRAEPSAIERGQNTILKWSTDNAKIVTISGLGEVPASGSREISPRVSTTYTASALGEGGNATASTRVTVTDPAGPPMAERPRTTTKTEIAPAVADQFRNLLKAVFFDYNKSDIRSTEQEKLRRIADWLNLDRNKSIVFRVEGNCDPRGTSEYNLGLGDRRTRAIKDFLVSLGVDPGRIETASYGSEKSQGSDEGSTNTPPSWAFDRRADFIYLRGGDQP
ncbi:MAG: OmpA family protein [Acidobacteria bacterium]|nr:OmpA family protein [Acidobacteriota bacterium]MBK8315965.1 OmpA family protein [Acidobacteriota bacterium]